MLGVIGRAVAPFTWSTDLPRRVWDRHLAGIRGHPLQSALWGDVRHAVDGIENHRWAAFLDGLPVFMARFEVRRIPLLGRVAWIPRGPTVAAKESARDAYGEFLDHLRRADYLLCVDDIYSGVCEAPAGGLPLYPRPRTAWLDLTRGHEKLWKALTSQFRYGVRTAARAGIIVEESREPQDVGAFYRLCEQISVTKGFALRASDPLLRALCAEPTSIDVDVRFFVARFAGELAAGALVLRCGRSLHYFWGAVDRRFSKHRAGEAVQWAVIEWALQIGVETYDLEGLDAENNPGTYHFKMKMGGNEICLPGRRAYPLSPAGRLTLTVGQWLRRI
jgi:hypothetical protein